MSRGSAVCRRPGRLGETDAAGHGDGLLLGKIPLPQGQHMAIGRILSGKADIPEIRRSLPLRYRSARLASSYNSLTVYRSWFMDT